METTEKRFSKGGEDNSFETSNLLWEIIEKDIWYVHKESLIDSSLRSLRERRLFSTDSPWFGSILSSKQNSSKGNREELEYALAHSHIYQLEV